jgi:Zn-dependent metalloprotease
MRTKYRHSHYKNDTCHNVCFIIPPFIYQSMEKNGTPEQKKIARRGLIALSRLSGIRRQTKVRPSISRNVHGKLERSIHDAERSDVLPGVLKRREGDETVPDSDINKAYDLAGDTFKFYKDVFNRSSIDNKNLSMISSCHVIEGSEDSYNNAAWTGEQMIYGETDKAVFKTVLLPTVVGHEMTHGVVQYEGDLTYSKDTGAMNEHFADAFGILTEQYIQGQNVEQSDWLIGKGIWGDGINGKALRSMSSPGTAYDDPVFDKDPQPATMDDYADLPIDSFNDWGGVHINSGIPNHAFYLASKEIGGNAWETTGNIWYTTLKTLPGKPNRTTFNDLANVTTYVAGMLYDANSKEQKAVINAWNKVGIQPEELTNKKFITLITKGISQ